MMNSQEREALLEIQGALSQVAEGETSIDLARYVCQQAAKDISNLMIVHHKTEDGHCKRCGRTLDEEGYCNDVTCPHSNYLQHETWSEG